MGNRCLKITVEPVDAWARWKIRDNVTRDADTVLMVTCCADGIHRQIHTELIGDKGDLLLCAASVVQALDKPYRLALVKLLWRKRHQRKPMKEVNAQW